MLPVLAVRVTPPAVYSIQYSDIPVPPEFVGAFQERFNVPATSGVAVKPEGASACDAGMAAMRLGELERAAAVVAVTRK